MTSEDPRIPTLETDLRALRQDMNKGFSDLRGEFRSEIISLRTDMNKGFEELRAMQWKLVAFFIGTWVTTMLAIIGFSLTILWRIWDSPVR